MLTILSEGPPISMGWLSGRLREIADLAAVHPPKRIVSPSRGSNDPSGRVAGRFSSTSGTSWLTVIPHIAWDGRRTIRLVLRSRGRTDVFDVPCPRGRAADLVARLADELAEAADMIAHAEVREEAPAHPMPVVTMQAAAVHGAPVGTWLRADTPWHPPALFVRDAGGAALPIRMTEAGMIAAARSGWLVRHSILGGVHSIDAHVWAVPPGDWNVVEAMRAVADREALCGAHVEGGTN